MLLASEHSHTSTTAQVSATGTSQVMVTGWDEPLPEFDPALVEKLQAHEEAYRKAYDGWALRDLDWYRDILNQEELGAEILNRWRVAEPQEGDDPEHEYLELCEAVQGLSYQDGNPTKTIDRFKQMATLASLAHYPYISPEKGYKPAYPRLALSDVITEKPTSKGQARASLTVCSDTEFRSEGNQQNRMIITQLELGGKTYMFEHPGFQLGHVPAWGDSRFLLTELFDVTEKDASKGTLKSCSRFKADIDLTIRLGMFFSAADVCRGLFSSVEDRDYIVRHLTQKPVLKFEIGSNQYKGSSLTLPLYWVDSKGCTYKLKLEIVDHSGVAGKASLESTCKGLGITTLEKGLMDKYKTQMDVAYKTHPVEFLTYAAADAVATSKIEGKVAERNDGLASVQGLDDVGFKATIGSTVASLMEKWVKSNLHGIPDAVFKDILPAASVGTLARHHEDSYQVTALVQGGRAKNENPASLRMKGIVCDYDIAGAYATMMGSMVYPLGRPSITSYNVTEGSPKMTLGKWYKRNEAELVPRTWFVVVSGDLNHYQSLVHSKEINPFKVAEAYAKSSEIDAPFRLFTKGIQNAIITSDVMEMILYTCSDKERGEWLNLKVVAGLHYKKSDRCESVEEWLERYQAHVTECGGDKRATKENKYGGFNMYDHQFRGWVALPIAAFLTPYVSERKHFKGLEQAETDPTKKAEYRALQQQMKLVGNTLFGTVASHWFAIGNTVVANSITAGLRTSVWATAMATGAAQSITDGGPYEINHVRFWRERKPGMQQLSRWWQNGDDHWRKTAPLGSDGDASQDYTWECSGVSVNAAGVETVTITAKPGESSAKPGASPEQWSITASPEQWGKLDARLKEHVLDFFRPVEGKDTPEVLKLINYAHKHVYQGAAFHGQGDYCFKPFAYDSEAAPGSAGALQFKARGHKGGNPYNNGTERSHMMDILEGFLDSSKSKVYPSQTLSTPLKADQANKMRNSKTTNALRENGLEPGDSILKNVTSRCISVSQFHFQNAAQYHSWQKSHDKLVTQHGLGLEGFFYDPTTGEIEVEEGCKTIQAAIDRGEKGLGLTHGHDSPYLDREPDSEEDTYQDFLLWDELEDE
jgi:hypothetical protein